MSFSADVKIELSKINNLKNKDEVYYELCGYLASSNSESNSESIRFSTENEYNINRFSKLLNNLEISSYEINMQGKTYIIYDKKKNEKNRIIEFDIYNIKECNDNLLNLKNENYAKAFVRGCFLGGGSINNPNKNYHLEILLSKDKKVETLENVLQQYNIYSKTLIKENAKKSLYIKDGEEISKFLAFIGANSSMLKFEEIRVIRNMHNAVNRVANCETANIDKSINTAAKQMALIKQIKSENKYKALSDDLKEIIDLREENPNATLEELGKMLKKPIRKSSVSHRFKKIEELIK